MKEELVDYIESCYEYEEQVRLDDVYVTDHVPIPKKYTTTGEEEDLDYFEY
jgi:hypothetical protein